MTLPFAGALDGWGTPLAILAAGVLVGWLAKAVLLRRLRELSTRTATRADDVFLEATRRFWAPAIVLLAVLPAARFAPLHPDQRLVIDRLALTLFLIGVTLAASRFVRLWLATEPAEAGLPARPSLVQKVAQGAVLVAGFMLVLDNAGFEIKTLLTALGVTSLAVALALQPTLSNLFAGLHLSVAKPMRVGDFVELEDGTQGYVEDIGWRSTRIRQLANNLVLVPNARLSDMKLVNYSMPELPQAVLFTVGVAYGSDLRRVERVAVEVARAVQKEVPEGDPQHEPFVRFHTFGASSIDFNVILRARAFTDRWPLVHEYLMRLRERFDAEGIEIPFPRHVVRLERSAGDPEP
jgi:small-conductance mechanosensitive channel